VIAIVILVFATYYLQSNLKIVETNSNDI